MPLSNSPAPQAARPLLTLLAVCLAGGAMPVSFTGPAVALPAIGRALGGDPVALDWVTNGFMLTFGGGLMVAGALADGYGRRRLFLAGCGAFVLVSLLLAAAPSLLVLDLLRAAQGLAAAMTFSAGMAALAQETEGPQQLRAFSLVGASFGCGLAFGPIAAGVMIDAFGWRAIFALGGVMTALAFLLAAYGLRETRDPRAAGLDWPGASSFTAALTLFTYGALEASESGFAHPLVLGSIAASVLLFAAFWIIERRVARPMLDLTLFRYPRFVGVQVLAAAPAYAFVVLLVLLPIRFIGVEDMSPIAAGRLMIALSAPLLVLPILAGQLTRWYTPATICGIGLVISAGGLLWLSEVSMHEVTPALLAAMATIGIGISLPWGLMDGLAVSVVPKERAGMATGIFSTTRVAGEGVALAIVTSGLSALVGARLGTAPQAHQAAQKLVTGDPAAAVAASGLAPETLVQAYDAAFGTLLMVLSAATLLAAILVFAFLRRGEARPAADAPHIADAPHVAGTEAGDVPEETGLVPGVVPERV